MEKPIAVLELGSQKLKLVVGYELNGQPYVVYTLVKPYGELLIDNGKILDPEKVSNLLSELNKIVDPSAKLTVTVADVVLCVPPFGLIVERTQQMTAASNMEASISNHEIRSLYNMIKNSLIGTEKTAIDIVPKSFILSGGRSFTKPPIGELSNMITLNALVHECPKRILESYTEVVNNSGLNAKRAVASNFAAIELVEAETSKEVNAFLIDIGSNTTSVSLVGRSELFNSVTFPWGGDNITQKIVSNFGINEADAEKYKITYGIDKLEIEFKAPVCVTTDEEGNQISHSIDELNVIIKSELDEFVAKLNTAIETLLSKIPDGKGKNYEQLRIILTGGGSKLFGLTEYILPKVKTNDITVFTPKTLGARNGTFVNCLGALIVCSKYPNTLDDLRPRVGQLTREKSIIK